MASSTIYMKLEGQIEDIEKQIERKFDNIIESAERRKSELLSQVKQLKNDLSFKEIEKMEILQNIEKLENVLNSMKVNKLEQMHNNILDQINEQKRRLRIDEKEQGALNFYCNTNEVLRQISNLGRVVDQVAPKYSSISLPVTSIGKVGSVSSQLHRPNGVAIDDSSERIFVVDTGNHRFQIFSMECEFIGDYDCKRLKEPHGIAYHQKNLYVTDTVLHNVFMYDCTSYPVFTRSVNDMNFSIESQARKPHGIAVDPATGEVYVTDTKLNCVLVYSPELIYLRRFGSNLAHPSDVKVFKDFVYIVDYNKPFMHKYNRTGSLITDIYLLNGDSTIETPQHFSVDCMGNFLISNWKNDTVDIAHPDGDVYYSIGSDAKTGTVLKAPKGLAVTRSGRVVVVSETHKNWIQIF